MAHAQKPDFVFPRNGRAHLNRRGHQFSRLLAAEMCASAVVMLDTPCSEVECNSTGYPLHSHVFPSLPLPCVSVCHQVSTELYRALTRIKCTTWGPTLDSVCCSQQFLKFRKWNTGMKSRFFKPVVLKAYS